MLHAICQDTYPPIFYLNETSHALINFVTQFNHVSKEIKLAYTFDAGIVSNRLLKRELRVEISAEKSLKP